MEPSPASTILLLRQKQDVIEVLMAKRSHKTDFASLYVFPGGKVDQDDISFGAESKVCDLNDGQLSNRINVESGGSSFWIAAVRECFEEVGVLLTHNSEDKLPNFNKNEKERFSDYRNQLLRKKISFKQICEKENFFIKSTEIVPFAHWITPEFATRRYDTRFFITRMPENQDINHDGNELIENIWISPQSALQKVQEGKMQMILPTIKCLEQLMEFESIDNLMAHYQSLDAKDIQPNLPKFVKKDGQWKELLPGDEGY